MSGPTLSYESGLSGALQPGEQILWEQRPDASRFRESWTLCGLLVGIVTFIVGVSSASATRDVALTFIAAVASIVFVGGAMLLAASGNANQRRKAESLVYRITNRRIMRVREEPVHLVTQAEIENLLGARVAISRSGDASVDVGFGVSLPHLSDPHGFVARVLDVVRQSGRRARAATIAEIDY